MTKRLSKGSGKPIPKVEIDLEVSPGEGEELLETLQIRFEENLDRHQGLEWAEIGAKLEAQPERLSSLNAIESTGGEPDMVGFDKETAPAGDHQKMTPCFSVDEI